MSAPAVATNPPGPRPQHRLPAVVTLDAAATGRLLARLAAVGVAPYPLVSWGTVAGYRHLLRAAPPLVLLDLAGPADRRAVDRLVRGCRLLAPVAVLTAAGTDPVPALEAGAVDVMNREAPALELAARLRADLRRPSPVPARSLRITGGSAAQFLLLDLLGGADGPVCCHELRWLLGRPGHPLPLPTLKLRMQRLQPLLRGTGLTLHSATEYGLATYRLGPAPTKGSDV
ncbi:response regulator transcription factor [Kitasatospora azatica]|uniref:response regulator transcription factor n=1 Tax=Kitasatospora azatica TaxID=58347 RepID=UPI00068E894D|nr:response regulator transcription factor [Kitasatospora azatica]